MVSRISNSRFFFHLFFTIEVFNLGQNRPKSVRINNCLFKNHFVPKKSWKLHVVSRSLVTKSIPYQSNRLFNIQVIQFKVTKSFGSFFRNNQNTWCIVKHASDVSCNWFNLWWESRFLGWLTTASSVSGISFRGFFGWNCIDAGSLSVNVRKKISNWF